MATNDPVNAGQLWRQSQELQQQYLRSQATRPNARPPRRSYGRPTELANSVNIQEPLTPPASEVDAPENLAENNATLRAELHAQSQEITRLEFELSIKQAEIGRLRAEKQEANAARRRVIDQDDQAEVRRLKMQVGELKEMLDEAEETERNLLRALDASRAREMELSRILMAAPRTPLVAGNGARDEAGNRNMENQDTLIRRQLDALKEGQEALSEQVATLATERKGMDISTEKKVGRKKPCMVIEGGRGGFYIPVLGRR